MIPVIVGTTRGLSILVGTYLEDVCGEHSSSEFQTRRPYWKMAHLEEDTDVALMYIFSGKPAHDDPQRRELSLDGGQDAP